MTTITLPRATVEQALEALENEHRSPRGYGYELSVYEMRETSAAIAALRAALAQPLRPPVTKGRPRKLPEDNDHGDWDRINALEASLREHMAEIHRLRAALARPSPATLIDPRGSLGEPIV